MEKVVLTKNRVKQVKWNQLIKLCMFHTRLCKTKFDSLDRATVYVIGMEIFMMDYYSHFHASFFHKKISSIKFCLG